MLEFHASLPVSLFNAHRYSKIKSLRLVGAGGRCIIARDVVVFRVDSLEDEAIGQAIVFSDWEVVA